MDDFERLQNTLGDVLIENHTTMYLLLRKYREARLRGENLTELAQAAYQLELTICVLLGILESAGEPTYVELIKTRMKIAERLADTADLPPATPPILH